MAVLSFARRALSRGAVLLAVIGVVGCGGADAAETTGGTVPLFGGTVPDGRPAIDLSPSSDRDTGRDVVVIGDSITVASAPQIEAAAEELDVDVTVLGEVGRRITVGRQPAAGTDVLAEVLAEGDPDLVVVALGTNDIGKYTTIAEYAGQIDELVGMLPEDQPLVWINTYLENTPDASATFNAALLETLTDRGTATIGRWSSIAQRDGMLSDGIHPSDQGTEEFADLVLTEIENWLG
ncbi:MAG TPA: GDSL-type esterase/lipase family protein [Desertimonas sp.]|nr:GDSL-type esterase/lipase family protein [Desertimonas sp.]